MSVVLWSIGNEIQGGRRRVEAGDRPRLDRGGAGGRPDAARDQRDLSLWGQGELAAFSSADPLDTRGFRGTVGRVCQGVCQAILRPTGPGILTLRAEADGLRPAVARVRAE